MSSDEKQDPLLGFIPPTRPGERASKDPLQSDIQDLLSRGSDLPPLPPTDLSRSLGTALKNIREFADQAPMTTSTSSPAYAFDLRIDGRLNESDRVRLIDLLSSEEMGVRERDLEEQFHAERILIPRISEYAGVMLVHALRDSPVRVSLRPSPVDAEDTFIQPPEFTPKAEIHDPEARHSAEKIPVLAGSTVPGGRPFVIKDLLLASATLQSTAVEVHKSSIYDETVAALIKELKFRAHYEKADALIQFSVNLIPLASATQFRLTVMGTAIQYTDQKG